MDSYDAQAALAHYWDDEPDTLAGDQAAPVPPVEEQSGASTMSTFFYGALVTVVFFWVANWIKAQRRTRRERAFRLDLRRRHGIPDSDTRPFNVAYQAAAIAARDAMRESQELEAENEQRARDTASSAGNLNAGFRSQGRTRPPIPSFHGQLPARIPSGSFNSEHIGSAYQSEHDPSRTLSQLPNSAVSGSWAPRYSSASFRATSVPSVPTVSSRSAFAIAAAATSASRRPSNTIGASGGRSWQASNHQMTTSRSGLNLPQIRSRKRLFLTADEEAQGRHLDAPTDKRSRTAGWGSEDMIDGDNEPAWALSHPVESASDSRVPQIGKGKGKGKRLAEDAEGDHRAGGKRRHAKSDKSAVQEKRGTKRERKHVDGASVSNDVMPAHKRGKADVVDLTMVEEEEEPAVSSDPCCGGRRIGETWTLNGQKCKVGDDGTRLRQVTVKESRKKYFMPSDSKHPDNFHMIEVCVEKWVNDKEYAKAKADDQIVWPDNRPASVKQKSLEKAVESGKEDQTQEQLPPVSSTAITLAKPQQPRTTSLWNTPGQTPSPTSELRTNPFTTPASTVPQSPGPRRVRYTVGVIPPRATTESRMISAREKQEREANGLKILRERKAAAEAAAKASTPATTSSTTVSSATPALTVPAPIITVTAPSPAPTAPPVSSLPTPADKPAAPTFSFAPSTSKPSESAPAAPAPAPAPVPVPAPVPTPATATAPTPANPCSFAAPKKDNTTKSPFSATSVAPPTVSATAASSTLSFPSSTTPVATSALFSAPASTSAAPAPTAATASPFGAPTSAAASKPSPFAFSAASTTSQPTAPAATNVGTTPAGTSPFGTTPATSTTALGSKSTAPAASSPFAVTPAAAPAKSVIAPSSTGFSFGVTPAAPSPAATKPTGGFSFNPAPAAAPAKSVVAPASTRFSFGVTPAAPSPAATKPMGGFSFNPTPAAAPANSAAAPSSTGFSFGVTPTAPSPAATKPTGGFSFNPAPAAAPAKSVVAPASTGFSFGVTPAAPSPAATKPMGGFSFNPTPAAAPANSAAAPAGSSLFSGQAAAKPASTGFSFNTANSNANGASNAKPVSTGFSFNTTNANGSGASIVKPSSSGFSFAAPQSGTTPASTGFGTAVPTTNATTSGFGTGYGTNQSTETVPTASSFGFGSQPPDPALNTAFILWRMQNLPQFAAAAEPTLTIPASNDFGSLSTATPTTANELFDFGALANFNGAAANGGFDFGALAGFDGAAAFPDMSFNSGVEASPATAARVISGSKRVQRALSKPPQ